MTTILCLRGLRRLRVLADVGDTPYEYRLFLVMSTIGALLTLAALIYVVRAIFDKRGGEIGGLELRGARQRVMAVARTTLADALRTRVASGLALVILAALPIFWLSATGDGTIRGRVQMFMAYSLGFAIFCLAMVTIVTGCRSLALEIASRQIYLLASKPIFRWQILAGKWIGIMTLNVALLGIAAVGTYVGTRAIVSRFRSQLRSELKDYSGLSAAEADRAVASLDQVRGIGQPGIHSPIVEAVAQALGKPNETVTELLLRLPEQTRVNLRRLDELRRQVLVSRASVPAEAPDFSDEVNKAFTQMKEEGRLPEGMGQQEVIEQLRKNYNAAFCAVSPGDYRQWKLKGPPPEKGREFILSIRFKIRGAGQLLAASQGGLVLEADTLLCRWGVGDPRTAKYLETQDTCPVNTYYELEIPTRSVAEDGTVQLTFLNADPRRVAAIFDLANRDLELLYRVGSFEGNLVQVCLAALIPLACLCSMAVCASTFLTFPVGTLIVVTLYVITSSMGFVNESLALTKDYVGPNPGVEWHIRKAAVDGLDWALAIGDLDPIQHLLEGRSIGWGRLAGASGKFLLLKSLLVMAAAVMIFRRRELAAVIV
jgi:hypothetical protein